MDLEKFKYRPSARGGAAAGASPKGPPKGPHGEHTPLGRTIPPILAPNLQIVFIGFNPGTRSGQTGHHYAHHSNRFWKLLAASGLSKQRLQPTDDRSLLGAGYGFTDLVARTTKSASVLTRHEKLEGAAKLEQRLRAINAEYLCFVGKGVWEICSRYKGIKSKPKYGLQDETFANSKVFVVPSTSGLVSISWDVQLELWTQLQSLVATQADLETGAPAATSLQEG